MPRLRLGVAWGAFYDLRNFPHDEKQRFLNSVTNGKRAMPAWGALVKPAEIELLWAYVASYKPQYRLLHLAWAGAA